MISNLLWIRLILPGVILLIYTSSFGQSQPVVHKAIDWSFPTQIIDSAGKAKKVLDFAEAYHDPANAYLPTLKIVEYKNVVNLKLLNVKYLPATEEELKLIEAASLAHAPSVKIEVSSTRRTPFSTIAIVPLRKNSQTGQVEKVVSMQYQYELATNNNAAFTQRGMNGYASASVLAQGDWYKLAVTESGIYKIDAGMLSSMGINIASVNPRNIALYGNGGGMLPQAWVPDLADDLQENAIYVEGEADGQFNNADYILFYAQGPDKWLFDAANSSFKHQKNVYADTAYYFLTLKSTAAQRVKAQPNVPGGTRNITTYDYTLFYEQDLENVQKSGREWYGEKFEVLTDRTFSFDITGIASNGNIMLTTHLMANAFSVTSFTISANGQAVGTVNMPARSRVPYTPVGTHDERVFNINPAPFVNSAKLDIKLQYNRAGGGSGYLNFLRLQLKRKLALYGNQTSFRAIESLEEPVINYIVESAPEDIKVWDITNPVQAAEQAYSRSGSVITFGADNSGRLREFIAFSGNTFSPPRFAGKVANQNLHALTADVPELVILTSPEFLAQAQRLADFKRSFEQMPTQVVTVQQVYNEFSSGAQDITAIRNFAKMLYDMGGNRFKYILLLGDASYDYKKSNAAGNTNFVPIYESYESLDQIKSFSSDDYIGVLEQSNQGWLDNRNYPIDIGIGRLPVKTAAEAEVVVNKIINYSSSNLALGKWRNQVMLVADDGDNNLHLRDAETLSRDIITHRAYNINKVYLAANPKVPGPGGNISPITSKAIEQGVEDGSLIVNFSGHGNTRFWTDEVILDKGMIQSWTNKDKLAFFVTATCDFGKYDDPGIVSGGEMIMLSEKGAGIGLLTSSRPVYSGNNLLLNRAFYRHVFTPVNGVMPRLGDVQRLTKNASQVGSGNRNFALIGDPSMRLAYPKEEIAITKVNDKPVQGAVADTIKALSKVTMEGQVRTKAGMPVNDFNGTLVVTVFDKESEVNTIPSSDSPLTNFKLRRNIIFDGNVKVVNGKFNFTFVVPKDISYIYGEGKISMYAHADQVVRDAHGAHNDVIIGGGEDNIDPDHTPPVIRLFMNDSTFVFGGTTGPNPKLMARLSDENGINVSSTGVGHEITAVLDNDRENILVLNKYYSADTGDYTSGTVSYDLKNMALGTHSISLKAWDTHNNSAESYIEFVVADDAVLALSNVMNYPNPFTDYTTFHFDHNHAGRDLDIQVQIYTITGKLIHTLSMNATNSTTHIGSSDPNQGLSWNGYDDYGDKIGRGVYIYRINVRSSDGSQAYKVEKLVILR